MDAKCAHYNVSYGTEEDVNYPHIVGAWRCNDCSMQFEPVAGEWELYNNESKPHTFHYPEVQAAIRILEKHRDTYGASRAIELLQSAGGIDRDDLDGLHRYRITIHTEAITSSGSEMLVDQIIDACSTEGIAIRIKKYPLSGHDLEESYSSEATAIIKDMRGESVPPNNAEGEDNVS
jgi:hypothetical protein